MRDPFVKICGVTRLDDAVRAVALGAGAIGFIFWPRSPRFIDPYRARPIVRALPPFVTPVGVFVDQPIEYVNAVAGLLGLGAVQLHGDEDQAYARQVRRPVVKALSGAALVEQAAQWPSVVMPLVDTHDPVQRGGTGRTADWTAAAALAARVPILLAGGVNADNVTAALDAVRPFGIDVSSGVEAAPGVKDHEKLTMLFTRVRAWGSDLHRTEVRR